MIKSTIQIIFMLLYLFVCSPKKSSAQNWFPMEVGNEWQYLGHFENFDLNQEIYFLVAFEIVDSIISGNVKYYKWSKYPDYGFRFDQTNQKIIILEGTQEHLFMDFTVPQDSFIYRFEPDYNSYRNCLVYGYDFTFLDSTIYKKGYIISGEIFQSSYYSVDLGHVSFGWGSDNLMWGRIRSDAWLIQANINGINYSADYYPEIIFEPITQITDSDIQFTIEVNHPYNYLTPTLTNKLNYIDTVYIHQFYSKNGNVMGNSTLQAYNVSNTPNWVFNANLDTNLLNNHYHYNYRIEAIDKGLLPRRSFAPDSGYYVAIYDSTVDYYPEIVFTPIYFLSGYELNLQFEVNHHYNQVYPGSTSEIKSNFISDVIFHSYYSKNDSIINNESVLAINIPNSEKWIVNFIFSNSLRRENYKLYYRIEAIDKGTNPNKSFSPESGYFQTVFLPIHSPLLYSNYPNPFNSSTNISYNLPAERYRNGKDVIMKIFDVLGNEILTLLNEEQLEGTYKVVFDASGLTSGIYFYQLRAGNYVETKKMVLLR